MKQPTIHKRKTTSRMKFSQIDLHRIRKKDFGMFKIHNTHRHQFTSLNDQMKISHTVVLCVYIWACVLFFCCFVYFPQTSGTFMRKDNDWKTELINHSLVHAQNPYAHWYLYTHARIHFHWMLETAFSIIQNGRYINDQSIA